MVNNLELKKKHIDYLLKMPENGMGYQLVNILLKDGRELKKRVILNSKYLKLAEGEQIENNQIRKVTLLER